MWKYLGLAALGLSLLTISKRRLHGQRRRPGTRRGGTRAHLDARPDMDTGTNLESDTGRRQYSPADGKGGAWDRPRQRERVMEVCIIINTQDHPEYRNKLLNDLNKLHGNK